MADILIRGMEMPTEHRTEALIFKNGFVAYYDVYGRYLGQAKATQLPEGHGRLGDLDALSKQFEHLASLDWNQKAAPYSWAYAYSEAQAAVDDSPTIVPAEGGKIE